MEAGLGLRPGVNMFTFWAGLRGRPCPHVSGHVQHCSVRGTLAQPGNPLSPSCPHCRQATIQEEGVSYSCPQHGAIYHIHPAGWDDATSPIGCVNGHENPAPRGGAGGRGVGGRQSPASSSRRAPMMATAAAPRIRMRMGFMETPWRRRHGRRTRVVSAGPLRGCCKVVR